LVSCGNFVILWTFFSVATVSGKLIKEKGFGNLGFYGLTVLYLTFSCFCFVAPSAANMMNTKRGIQLGALSFTILEFCYYIATMESASTSLVTFSVIFGSICNGVGGSVFWTAHGKYLSDLVMICQEKSGLYTSVYWTITLGS
jgi:hypothetical protein